MTDTIEIFISYAHEDEDMLKELENHLAPLENKGRIKLWDVRKITPAMVSAHEIDKHLDAAQMILLLVSSNYVASNNYTYEVARAMERQRAGKAHVIPIILRSTYWQDEPFGNLKPLPDNREAATSWRNKGDAFFNIAEGIRKVVEGLIAQPQINVPSISMAQSKAQTANYPPTTSQPDHQTTANPILPEQFDVFMSHSHEDAEWVEKLAMRLEDEHGFSVWLDKWVLIPGQPFQPAMARGIDQAKCCVVCISEHTPEGWFKREIERALNRQTQVPSFRVIPILLPNAKSVNVNDFLELNTWVDYRSGKDPNRAIHLLVCGVKGIPPGR